MSKLQTDFINTFKHQQHFTTKEVFEWYCLIKQNPERLPQRIAIHQLIINPLMREGRVVRVDKGLYTLVETAELTKSKMSPEKDEFDEYIAQQIHKERR